MKFFILIFIFSKICLVSNEQIVFVLADNLDSKKAKLIRYEKINNKFKAISKAISVNLGQEGLAWGKSEYKFKIKKNEAIKKEGDKKALIGVYNLTKIYTYHQKLKTNMPYETSTKKHICVDDTNSNMYNKIFKTENKQNYKSYENMFLTNSIYEYVILIEHNKENIKELGSCIFLHVENLKKNETSGCTSMKKNEIKKIINWLNIRKEPILIQTPKNVCPRIKKQFNFIDCNL